MGGGNTDWGRLSRAATTGGLSELPGDAGRTVRAAADVVNPTGQLPLNVAARAASGYESMRRQPGELEKQRQEQQAKQDAAAAEAAAELKRAPRKVEAESRPLSMRRFRAGFLANIRTSPMGLGGPAPTTPAVLTGKKKLGE